MQPTRYRTAKTRLLCSASALLMAAGAQTTMAAEDEAANDDLASVEVSDAQTAQAQQQQQQDQPEDEELQLEEIVVTGSRISRSGFDTLQPTNVLSSEFVDDKGFQNIASAINEIPAFGQPGASSIGGGAGGGFPGANVAQNFVNAFGLGSQRTLTLINGRRVVASNTPSVTGGAAAGLQVDLNIIPTAMIDRVETVFVGGSPIYGTDAVAGTVNVILKDDFEGIEFDLQGGTHEDTGGDRFRVRNVIGSNFADGRGNATVATEFTHSEAILASERDNLQNRPTFCDNTANINAALESEFAPDTGPNDGNPDEIFCRDGDNVFAVPNTGAPLLFDFFPTFDPGTGPGGAQDFDDPAIDARITNAQGEPLLFGKNGGLVTWEQANAGNQQQVFFSQGADGANNEFFTSLQQINIIRSELQRWSIFPNIEFDINEDLTIFTEALFTRTEARDPINQPPWSTSAFGPENPNIRINIDDNPFLRESVKETLALNGLYDPDKGPDAPDDHFFMARSNIDLVGGAERSAETLPVFRDQDVFRIVTGAEGQFEMMGNQWDWDLSYNFGQTNADVEQTSMNQRRFQLAADAITDPRTGQPACRATVTREFAEALTDDNADNDPTQSEIEQIGFDNAQEVIDRALAQNPSAGRSTPGVGGDLPDDAGIEKCEPVNLFGINNNDEDVIDFLLGREIQRSVLQQQVVELNFSGELLELPAGPMQVAAGYTHRRERGEFRGGFAATFGAPGNEGGIGTETPDVTGTFNTNEIYGEALIPIIRNNEGPGFDVPFIESLELEPSLRFVDNSEAGNEVTWRAGGRLTPDLPFIEDSLTIRGNFTQTIRAPSIVELFNPRTQIATFANDPCDPRFIDSGPNPETRRENCEQQVQNLKESGKLPQDFELSGFTSLIVNATQPAFTGGNPNLDSEQSDSWTVGGVFSPNFLPGFTLSVDWVQFDIGNAIVQLSGTELLEACFDSPNFPDVEACNLFSRDSGFQVVDPFLSNLNAASRFYSGLTASVEWQFAGSDIPFTGGQIPGSFNITGSFNHVRTSTQQVGLGDQSIFDQEFGNEALRFQLNLQYTLEKLTLLWQTQHFSSFIGARDQSDEFRPASQRKAPGQRIHDLTVGYQISDNVNARFVIDNVFDQIDPDLVIANGGGGGNANAFRDAFGRRFTFGITTRF